MIRHLRSIGRELLRLVCSFFLLAFPVLAQTSAPSPVQCPPQAAPPSPHQLAAARAQARDHGVLWRITRDGRDSWLYGTVHAARLEWALPGAKLTEALSRSDTVALELDLESPQTQAALLRPAPLPRLRLSPALRQRLDQRSAALCVPVGSLEPLHPVLQVITLSALDMRWIGLDPSLGIDAMLAGVARASGKALVELETADVQIKALIPARPEEAVQIVERSLDDLESGLSRRVMDRLARAWAEGDLATLETYADWCDCIRTDAERSLMRRANDDRNPAMADRVAALHAEGRRVFAAVGALHMTGAQALPDLLARRGFTVERVPLR